MNDQAWLLQHWTRVSAQAHLRGCHALGSQLLQRYAEPQRVFHTARHLRCVVTLLDEAKADDRLQLAAWFHDAVYQPGRSDNEARSAELAREELIDSGMPAHDLDFVCNAVLATTSHRSATAAFAPLLDADMAVLAAPPDEYRAYCSAIREEFRAVPQFLFRRGRDAFLRSVLGRAAIYATEWGLARFETNARRNLTAELADR